MRKGELIKDSRRHAVALQKWIETKYKTEAAKRKSDAGRATQFKKMNELMAFFSKQNTASLVAMFDLQKEIVNAKLILTKKLDDLGSIDTFVKTNKGYKVTGAEGYVAIDKLTGGALKLVDRMEFSYNNFSPNVLKGWDQPSRN